MKKVTVIALALLLGFTGATLSAQQIKDTTFVFNQKKILVQDSLSQVKVTVLGRDSTELKKCTKVFLPTIKPLNVSM